MTRSNFVVSILVATGLVFGCRAFLRTSGPSDDTGAGASHISSPVVKSRIETRGSDFTTTRVIDRYGPLPMGGPDSEMSNALKEEIKKLKDDSDPSRRAWGAALELGWTDMSAAIEQLSSFVAADKIAGKKADLIAVLAEERIKGFDQYLMLVDDPQLRAGLVKRVVSSWALKDPRLLVDWAVSNFSGDYKNTALNAAAGNFGNQGRFEEADSVLKQMPYSSARSKAINYIALQRGKVDFIGALDWAKQLDLREDQQGAALRIIANSASVADIEDLVGLANKTSDSTVRNALVSAIGKRLRESDLESGISWAATLPDELRGDMQAKISAKIANSDLNRATKYALQITNRDSQARAIDEIASGLISSNLVAAKQWVTTLPSRDMQDRAVTQLVTGWYKIDSMALSDWINGLPSGGVRDRALFTLAGQLKNSDKVSAKEVASQIQDSTLRSLANSGL